MSAKSANLCGRSSVVSEVGGGEHRSMFVRIDIRPPDFKSSTWVFCVGIPIATAGGLERLSATMGDICSFPRRESCRESVCPF